MSTVTGIGNYSLASTTTASYGAQRRQRPDPAEIAEQLFAKLDSSGKGYIETSDLESALSGLASRSSTQGTASASEILGQFDGDGDGKVTQDEFSSGLQKLAEALQGQADQGRMASAMPPPPPPPGSDAGFTKDELSAQLKEIGSGDSQRASLIDTIINNFDAADSDGDGKVSFSEAMAYQDSTASGSATSTGSTAQATSSSDASDAQIFRQIMELLRYYGDGSGQQTSSSSLSVSA